MPSFTFYVTDGRYRKRPHTFYAAAKTGGQARAKATEFLLLSQHYQSVLVYEEGNYLFTVSRNRRALEEGRP